MEIDYKNKGIEKVCTDASAAQRKYGSEMSEKIHQRIDQISAAANIEELVQFRIGRCHPLTADRTNQYAMDLVHPQRLIFEKHGNGIQVAYILEIDDYH